jgi:LEA14-like dessication related protein
MRTWRVGVVAVLAMVAGGCSAFGRGGFKEPVVTFKEARVTGLGISGGSLEVVLNVYNPNGYRLDGTKVTYTVMVDSVKFGDGEYNTRFQVDEGQTSEVKLPLSFTYAGVGSAGRQLIQTGSVEYRVLGDLTVSTPIGSFTRGYDQKGRFSTLSR